MKFMHKHMNCDNIYLEEQAVIASSIKEKD